MDLLWKKKDGFYIDIFDGVQMSGNSFSDLLKSTDAPVKNDGKSTDYRQKGNEQKTKGNWYRAMRFYNDSLRYAENDSTNISLAFANRSLCFLKMEMYDKCIADIELAIEANYPEEMRSKLEDRRIYCLDRINTTIKISAPSLDFDANENYAGIADVLDVKYSKKYGRHIVAKCDIGVGKTVFIEEAFGPAQVGDVGQCIICNTCYKTTMNFIPCKQCTNALFCSQTCANNDKFHEFICGEIPPKHTPVLDMTSVLFAIDLFQSVDDLMKFVENVIKDKRGMTAIPSSSNDPSKSKYRQFLQLNLLSNAQAREMFVARAHNTYEKLMEKPLINTMFGTKTKKHFLMHLCVLHTNITLSNPFNTNTISGTFLLRSLLNHSCAPNILFFHYENKCVGITSRPIKKGAQIYMIYHNNCWSTPLNQQQLANIDFQCHCEKCKCLNWAISSDRIKSDPDFQYIENNDRGFTFDYDNYQKYLELHQRYINVLKRYGNLSWTMEMNSVAQRFELQLNQSCLFAPINFGNIKCVTECEK